MNLLYSIMVWAAFLLVTLEAGISFAADANLSTSLFKAVTSHNPAEVKRLLDLGADPNSVAKSNGETPIFRAVMALDYDTAVLLLDRGARLDYKDIVDMTVLSAACTKLDFTAKPTAPSTGKAPAPPLENTAMRIVRMLVERGASVTLVPPPAGKREVHSSAPLHGAASNWNATVELYQFLISNGADVNQPMYSSEKSLDGTTPIIYAALFNRKEEIKFLLKHGADVNVRTSNGDSAARLAFMRDLMPKEDMPKEDILALFLSHGAVLTTADKRAILKPMFSGFHEELKKRLDEVHTALCTAVRMEPKLEKATLEQLLTKTGVNDGTSVFTVVSANCLRGSCNVVLRHQFLNAEQCSPLGDLKACGGRISGLPGKTVITMSELSDLVK